ncbi:MAG: protoheme IX farnesyltransferase [Candidatus Zixiibacteriota bacterium]|nr:MAG: protoheme IX farnesyltransferase [candidate division Zixibacteria bacterium]
MSAVIGHYVKLTKPTVMSLVVFTGAVALLVEGSLISQPLKLLLVLTALYLTGGSANALNQYFERDIDRRMRRTAGRRPLPRGELTPTQALVFSIAIGLLGVVLFATVFNWLAAGLALVTLLFYSLFYTLWLKPHTPQNIVIGGAAGAMAPVGAWAAATGQMPAVPWIMFLIVLIWTPPHFWALALFCRDDYVKAKLPMMPVVKGERATADQIVRYTVALVLVSLSLVFFGSGWLYLVSAAALGAQFIRKSLRARRELSERSYRALFGYSIVYLFLLFTAMVVDSYVTRWLAG